MHLHINAIYIYTLLIKFFKMIWTISKFLRTFSLETSLAKGHVSMVFIIYFNISIFQYELKIHIKIFQNQIIWANLFPLFIYLFIY